MTTRDALINAMDKFDARFQKLGYHLLCTENHHDNLKDMSPLNVAQVMTSYALEKVEFETLKMVLDEIKFILDQTRD